MGICLFDKTNTIKSENDISNTILQNNIFNIKTEPYNII